jgi:hypothetical protein
MSATRDQVVGSVLQGARRVRRRNGKLSFFDGRHATFLAET